MQKRAHLHITGKVQGVFFRTSAKAKAVELGVTGWIENTPDGAVECVAEGVDAAVESFVAWCRKGSADAAVKGCVVTWEEPKNEKDHFHIVTGSRNHH